MKTKSNLDDYIKWTDLAKPFIDAMSAGYEPHKKSKHGLTNFTIDVITNGYKVKSTEASGEEWVFNKFEDLVEFLKKALAPTRDKEKFIENL